MVWFTSLYPLLTSCHRDFGLLVTFCVRRPTVTSKKLSVKAPLAKFACIHKPDDSFPVAVMSNLVRFNHSLARDGVGLVKLVGANTLCSSTSCYCSLVLFVCWFFYY